MTTMRDEEKKGEATGKSLSTRGTSHLVASQIVPRSSVAFFFVREKEGGGRGSKKKKGDAESDGDS